MDVDLRGALRAVGALAIGEAEGWEQRGEQAREDLGQVGMQLEEVKQQGTHQLASEQCASRGQETSGESMGGARLRSGGANAEEWRSHQPSSAQPCVEANGPAGRTQ